MAYVNVAIGAMNVFNQVQGGRLAKGQADLQAQQAEYAAQVENANALKTAGIIRRNGDRQVGAANAAYAGAGVKVGEGSALETEGQIYQNTERDAYQALLDGGRRARGLQTDATLTRIDGSMKQSAAYVNAAGDYA